MSQDEDKSQQENQSANLKKLDELNQLMGHYYYKYVVATTPLFVPQTSVDPSLSQPVVYSQYVGIDYDVSRRLELSGPLAKYESNLFQKVEPRKEQKAKTSPDLTSCIIGYRAWRVKGSRVIGSYREDPWTPGRELVSECPVSCHDSPDFNCSCGIYAFKNYELSKKELIENAKVAADRKCYVWSKEDRIEDSCGVLGKVYLWGKVIEHTWGWRAQYAYPAEFVVFDRSHIPLGSIYNVPVFVQ